MVKDANLGDEPIAIGVDEVRSIVTPFQRRTSGRKAALAMLSDHSVVLAKPAERLVALDFEGLKLEVGDLRAIWGAANPLRFPVDGDFDQGKIVVVKPTHRLALNEMDVEANKIGWDPAAAKAFEQIEEEDSSSPIGKVTSYEYHEAPSIWFSKPERLDESLGLVRLTDGQQFVLGTETGFSLKSMDGEGIVIARKNNELSVPLNRIRAIRFAQ